MKPTLIIAALFALLPFTADAQLKGIFKKVQNKVDNRVDKKVDQEIDKKLDEIEGKKGTTSTGTPAANTTPEVKPAENGLKSFSKYDFIPGEQILYYDNFENEVIAELPTAWNTSGTGEVVTLDKFPGKWLRLHKNFSYLTSNTKMFGENYTVEFDFILQLKNNGWMYPEFQFALFASKDEPAGGNNFLKDYKKNAAVVATIYPAEFKNSKARVNSYKEIRNYFTGDLKQFSSLENSYGIPVHVSIQVQKERFRMWINEEKMFDVPKAIPVGDTMNQIRFEVGSTNYAEEQYAVFISNIKVATGKPDTRHKLVEEGKFSTTGILFDFQSAVIKPESFAVIKEIAAVLTENPSLKIKVLGHTSSDGDDKANMELSKNRAAAVKDALVKEFSIDASRIETEGKGETQPVADNKTKEGKAANRRVEFVKN